MSVGSLYDVQQTFHHVHHHGNEKKATDQESQNCFQRNYSSVQKLDSQTEKWYVKKLLISHNQDKIKRERILS